MLRWLLVGEAIYWLSLFLSGVMAFLSIHVGPGFPRGFAIEAGISCLFESIAIPATLIVLAYQLKSSKPLKSAINWALIVSIVYIFAFWLNNTCNWVYVALYTTKGWAYVAAHSENVISFFLTTVGLLVPAIYSVYFAWKSRGTTTFRELKTRTIGIIVTLLGLYYLWNYLTCRCFALESVELSKGILWKNSLTLFL
jgi:hypothetical protein